MMMRMLRGTVFSILLFSCGVQEAAQKPVLSSTSQQPVQQQYRQEFLTKYYESSLVNSSIPTGYWIHENKMRFKKGDVSIVMFLKLEQTKITAFVICYHESKAKYKIVDVSSVGFKIDSVNKKITHNIIADIREEHPFLEGTCSVSLEKAFTTSSYTLNNNSLQLIEDKTSEVVELTRVDPNTL